MFGTTLYIMRCTTKNRVRRRLQRLREPRYLIGAIVGTAYLAFALLGRARSRRFASENGGRRQPPANVLAAFATTGPPIAGLALLVGAAASWLMPFGSGLLDFTKAETEFLFPAPVSRRELLFYRLMRSQWAVLFGALIVALTYPAASIAARVRSLISMWLLLMTCHVFFTGVTLARSQTPSASRAARRIAYLPLIFTLGALAAIVVEVVRHISQHSILTIGEAFTVIRDVAVGGVTHVLLLPFIAVVRPLFVDSFASFLLVLPGALAVYAVTVAWVLRADETFGDIAETQAAEKVQQPARRATPYQARDVGWTLALEGRPETVFVWKAALQTFRIVDRRVLLRLVLIVVWVITVVMLIGRARGIAQGLGVFAAFNTAFAIVFGPQLLRLDLRQDLQHLETLKTWPARPSVVVRGEMAWPVIVITLLAWTFGLIAIILSAAAFSRTGMAWRLAIGIGGLIVAPALIMAQYTIHNAAALIFPAWVPVGGGRPRGVDAMGQRLIMLGATWLLLILAVLPGALVGGILWLAFFRFVGPWILIPSAAVCASIVMLEVLMATEALGPAYEQLDISSVERGE